MAQDKCSTSNKDSEKSEDEEIVPPDGGCWAWVVMVACFLCNGLVLGLNNAYGVIYVRLVEELTASGDPNPAFKASLMGSLTFGSTLCCSPIAGILVDKIGIRMTVFVGGTVAVVSLLASSFFIHMIGVLYLTYGVMLGFGLSLIYSPSLTMVGHYFRKKFGIVNGLVTTGSAVFTLIMYFLLGYLIDNYGLSNCFRILSVMMVLAMLSSLTFKPVLKTKKRDDSGGMCASIINFDNWRNPKYVVWVMSIFFGLFGYLVPLVHLVKFVKDIIPDVDGTILLITMQMASFVSRVIFGKLADISILRHNRVPLQQLAFVVMGILTMLLNVTTNWPTLIVFCVFLGLADGCFWCAEGPIAYDLCGVSGAAQALGFMKGLMGISFAAGPPIAGMIYDYCGDYTGAFIGAGIPPIISAVAMCYINRKSSKESQQIV